MRSREIHVNHVSERNETLVMSKSLRNSDNERKTKIINISFDTYTSVVKKI